MTLDTSGAQAAPVADSATPEPTAAPPRLTLEQILAAMTAPERMLDAIAEQGVDCGDLVGDLQLGDVSDEDAREALGRKVDSLRYVVDQFEAYAERTDGRAQTLAKKAKAAWNQAGRVRVRLLEQMSRYGFERLPGIDFAVERRRASNPSLVVVRPPQAGDMLDTPEYVAEVPTSYSWRADVLKKALKEGATHSFARLDYTYRVEFVERDRPDVAPKTKGKKK